MGNFNHFGGTVQGVVDRFPQSSPDALGGEESIVSALDDAEAQVAAACPPRLFSMLTMVYGEFLTEYANAGETEYTARLSPVDESQTVLVWRNYRSCPAPPPRGLALIEGSDYTKSVAGGKLTITLTSAMSAGENLLVSYDLNVADSAYGFALLASLTEKLAAVDRGALAYNQGDVAEANVTAMGDDAQAQLQNLRDNKDIPDEIRVVKLCADWESTGSRPAGSVQWPRG